MWIVEGLEGNEINWKEVYRIHDPDARSITVLNLRPYTTYRLRIIAVNIVGPSLKASNETSEFQTLQAAPSQPPNDVTVRAQNDPDTIRISWTVSSFGHFCTV